MKTVHIYGVIGEDFGTRRLDDRVGLRTTSLVVEDVRINRIENIVNVVFRDTDIENGISIRKIVKT